MMKEAGNLNEITNLPLLLN